MYLCSFSALLEGRLLRAEVIVCVAALSTAVVGPWTGRVQVGQYGVHVDFIEVLV